MDICNLQNTELDPKYQISSHQQDALKLFGNPVRMSRHMDTSSATQMAEIIVRHHWIQWFSLNENFRGHPFIKFFLLERQLEEVSTDLGWDRMPNWECQFIHRKQG